jgi:hypothetical protein
VEVVLPTSKHWTESTSKTSDDLLIITKKKAVYNSTDFEDSNIAREKEC